MKTKLGQVMPKLKNMPNLVVKSEIWHYFGNLGSNSALSGFSSYKKVVLTKVGQGGSKLKVMIKFDVKSEIWHPRLKFGTLWF